MTIRTIRYGSFSFHALTMICPSTTLTVKYDLIFSYRFLTDTYSLVCQIAYNIDLSDFGLLFAIVDWVVGLLASWFVAWVFCRFRGNRGKCLYINDLSCHFLFFFLGLESADVSTAHHLRFELLTEISSK